MQQKNTKRNKIQHKNASARIQREKRIAKRQMLKQITKRTQIKTKTHRMFVTASTSYVVNKIMICLTEPEIYESLYVTEAHQHTWHTTVRRSA